MDEHQCAVVCLIVLLICLRIDTILCCSPLPHWEPQTVEARAEEANVIAYAQAVNIYPLYPDNPHSQAYTAEFRLLCALKHPEKLISAVEERALRHFPGDKEELLFNVTEMGYFPGLCHKAEAIKTQIYFIFLTLQEDIEEDSAKVSSVFIPDFVNLQNPIIDDTYENRLSLEQYSEDCSFPETTTGQSTKTWKETHEDTKVEKEQQLTTPSNEKIITTQEFKTHSEKSLKYVAKGRHADTTDAINTTSGTLSWMLHVTQLNIIVCNCFIAAIIFI